MLELLDCPRFELALAGLFHDLAFDAAAQEAATVAEQICRRLKLSNQERERITNLVRNHMFWYTPEWSDGTVRRFIARVGDVTAEKGRTQ